MQTSVSDVIFGLKYTYFKNDMMASSSIGIKKEWEPHITKFTECYNNAYNIANIIDVGANFGYHTLLFSKKCYGNVYAFEPQIQNFKLLEENIKNTLIIILKNLKRVDTWWIDRFFQKQQTL